MAYFMERAPKRHLFDKVACLLKLEAINNRTNKCGTTEIKDDRAQYQSQNKTQNLESCYFFPKELFYTKRTLRKTKCNLFACKNLLAGQ